MTLSISAAAVPLALCTMIIFIESFMIWKQALTIKKSVESKRRLEEALQKEKVLRDAERVARINLQKTGRHERAVKVKIDGYIYHPIAVVESPFPDRRGTPRQPLLARAAKGKILFDKSIIHHDHFKELSAFSHIWVIFIFHENTSSESSCHPKAKVKPPRLHGQSVGCLSTRSPHRPNNIGLSVCEIIGVKGDHIEIACLDMVNGTPVLDIKPFIPYDNIPSDIQLPMAKDVNGESLLQRKLQVPQWIYEADIEMRPVTFSSDALQSISDISKEQGFRFCVDDQEAVQLITQVLRQDIRGIHQGRGSEVETSFLYKCRLDTMNIAFETRKSEIFVVSVQFTRYASTSSDFFHMAI